MKHLGIPLQTTCKAVVMLPTAFVREKCVKWWNQMDVMTFPPETYQAYRRNVLNKLIVWLLIRWKLLLLSVDWKDRRSNKLEMKVLVEVFLTSSRDAFVVMTICNRNSSYYFYMMSTWIITNNIKIYLPLNIFISVILFNVDHKTPLINNVSLLTSFP